MCVRVCACVCVYRPRGAACLAPLRTAQAFGIAPDMHAGRRFLAGADAAVDYARVDADAALDEDLVAEAERDLAERYFDAG